MTQLGRAAAGQGPSITPVSPEESAVARAPSVAEVRGALAPIPFVVRTTRRARALARDRSLPRSAELARTYVRMKIRQRLLRRFPSLDRRRERILDRTIEVFDYWILVYLFEEIFLSRDYFFRSESARPRIVDCGTHVGLAILYFKWLHPGARILGFEADPDTFALLERNVVANGLADVEIENVALYPGRASVTLYRDAAWGGVPFTSTDRRFVEQYGSRGGAPQAREVPATTLSAHLDEPVDFLKMDIEGAELPVIEELAASGKLELVRRMAIEYHHHIDPGVDRLGVLLGILERHGFGYQIRAPLDSPIAPRTYQNVLVHAYRD